MHGKYKICNSLTNIDGNNTNFGMVNAIQWQIIRVKYGNDLTILTIYFNIINNRDGGTMPIN